jgi:hypothetical protein
MAYDLEGRLVELCSCGARCPCRADGEPDGGTCDAVNTWHIDKGTIGGTDVSGLTLVALNRIQGHVLKGRSVVFYVDDTATDQQQAALLNVWTGKLGGPIADVAQLIGDVVGLERAAIAFRVQGGKGLLKVGQVLDARLATPSRSPGGTGHAAAPHDDVCTTLPGSEASVGAAATYRVSSPTYGFELDLQNYQVMQGRFHFQG